MAIIKRGSMQVLYQNQYYCIFNNVQLRFMTTNSVEQTLMSDGT